jgi:hypothetical protein
MLTIRGMSALLMLRCRPGTLQQSSDGSPIEAWGRPGTAARRFARWHA